MLHRKKVDETPEKKSKAKVKAYEEPINVVDDPMENLIEEEKARTV